MTWTDPTGLCGTCGLPNYQVPSQSSSLSSLSLPVPYPPQPPSPPDPTPPGVNPPAPGRPCPDESRGGVPGWLGCGNWCGPGSDLDRQAECRPVDVYDSCCLQHDMCYEINGISWWNKQNPFTRVGRAKLCCDANLCVCLADNRRNALMDPAVDSYINRVIGFFCECEQSAYNMWRRWNFYCSSFE